MMKPFLPAFICLLLCSCASNEIGNSKDVNPETIYTSYEISYTEGDDMVSCLARFRFAGKNGTTLVLTNPSSIQLDGAIVPVDSSLIDGAFYRATKQFDGFEGKHSFVFTGVNGKTYPQPFMFTAVKLSSPVPAKTRMEDMTLSFTGLEDGDLVHVELEDTAAATGDINRIDTIKNGKLLISATDFEKLQNGPVNMGFYIARDLSLENSTAEGGKLTLFYKLKQQQTLLEK